VLLFYIPSPTRTPFLKLLRLYLNNFKYIRFLKKTKNIQANNSFFLNNLMNLKHTLPLLLATLSLTKLAAQDIHFSQMQYAPLNLNPALAGANNEMQGVLNFKSQWKSITPTPYQTINAAFDMRVYKIKSGYFVSGLNVFNDKAGDGQLSTTSISIPMGYHLKLDKKNTLGGALYAGIGQRSINYDKFQWANQYNGTAYDPTLQTGETFNNSKFVKLDLGFGVVYTYNKNERNMTGNDHMRINAGLALYHVNQPKYTFVAANQNDRQYMRFSAFVSGEYGIQQTNISFMPAVYYNQQATQKELLLGTYAKYTLKEASVHTGLVQASAASLGVFYRNKDAVIIKAMYEHSNYSGGVAYDLNTSSLAKTSKAKGGFELFVRYIGGFSKSRVRTK
jgi:type IX secretion system PorP/SprF family membrane protein